jgi:hypothetical protein
MIDKMILDNDIRIDNYKNPLHAFMKKKYIYSTSIDDGV